MKSFLWLLLVPLAFAGMDNSRDSVSVILPTTLAATVGDQGRIPAKPALFGKFYYGRLLDAPFRLMNQTEADKNYYACEGFNVAVEDLTRPFIGVVRRGGGCTFVKKSRNVQDAGAAAIVVVNNDDNEPDYMGISGTEYALSSTIDIPATMIRKVPGEAIISSLESGGKVRGQLQVLKPNPANNESLNVDLYLRLDETPADFMEKFSLALASLGDTVNVSVHFIIDQGQNTESCTNHQRYCAQSKDVVVETLRQLCIFKKLGWREWASYYNIWMNKCGAAKDFSDSCFRQIYDNADIVERCIVESGGIDGDRTNTLLESELRDTRQIRYSPILIVNDAIFESQLTCNSVHDCAPLSFLCMMFADSDQPSTCFTSSACDSFGQVPDVCGICRPLGDKASITDPSQCPVPIPSHRVPFVTILLIFIALSVGTFVMIMCINHHLRKRMRLEVDAIMSEYTPLHDASDSYQDTEYSKHSYRMPAS